MSVLRNLRDRLTYSNVMATTAVFVALGGTSYAAITLPRNSVGSNQIRSQAVRSSDIRDRTIAVRDISREARSSLKGERGPQGLRGPQGPAGSVTTVNGNIVVRTNVTYKTESANVAADSTSQLTVQCDPGLKVIGGGFRKDAGSDLSARESYPSNNNTAWTVFVGNDDVPPAPTGRYTVTAICADVNG